MVGGVRTRRRTVWDMVPRKVLVGIETADCLPALSLAAEEAVAAWVRRSPPARAAADLRQPPAHRRARAGGRRAAAGRCGCRRGSRADDGATVARRPRGEHRAAPRHRVLVLGRGQRPRLSPGAAASRPRHDGLSHLLPTIHSVVASAHCPVLVVPQTWQSEESARAPPGARRCGRGDAFLARGPDGPGRGSPDATRACGLFTAPRAPWAASRTSTRRRTPRGCAGRTASWRPTSAP